MKEFSHLVFHVFFPAALIAFIKYAILAGFVLLYLKYYFDYREIFTWVILVVGVLVVFGVFRPIEVWAREKRKANRRRIRDL